MNAIINGSKWTLGYPELGTEPVAVEPFVSPEYFALKREKVFRNSWLNVGVTREIPNPGDYIVREIEITKTSLIIVRGRDNVIRGLHNVCKHRGNKLTQACNGTAKSFVCGFHGWSYNTTGKLVHVPDEDQFFDFDKSDYPLSPVATDVLKGFIF